ncbi:ER membrane protein complex subunit 3-like [Anthonomus grandis grandis]|uniref:ER membrane protein complex subunit 3-like n=1 Tax=Anthonomus grandis grandis TaxID=2921223 RepID=UPI002166C0B6|nr:ER membrane protein complex subunit 3-like [Anthonomus grandis grandis]
MTDDFLLDSKIRLWVFLPIVLLTFFIEILRYYVIALGINDEVRTLEEIQDSEANKRIRLLLKNHQYITKSAFEVRKRAFNPETGFLNKPPQQEHVNPLELQHPEKILNTIKDHFTNHLPMIIAGAWVSYTFSGFICTKIPFPLTFSFKWMLQQNIELQYLNPSWVSSCSWYLLNIFGLRNFLNIFFEDPPISDMDVFAEEQVSCKEDYNSLQIIKHKFCLFEHC